MKIAPEMLSKHAFNIGLIIDDEDVGTTFARLSFSVA
jgi:hypothetical protein